MYPGLILLISGILVTSLTSHDGLGWTLSGIGVGLIVLSLAWFLYLWNKAKNFIKDVDEDFLTTNFGRRLPRKE